MTSGILAVGALVAVFVTIWLVIKIEHVVVRVLGFAVALAACLFVAHLFIGGGL